MFVRFAHYQANSDLFRNLPFFVKAFLRFCINYLFVRNVTKRQLCRVLLQKNAVWQNLPSDKRCDKFFLANFVLTLSF